MMSRQPEWAMEPASESVLDGHYLSIAQDRSLWAEPLRRAVMRLTEAVGRSLDVRRVSLWLPGGDASVLEQFDLFDSRDTGHRSGAVLARSDFPAYFAALENDRVVAAGDALVDSRTRELAATWLIPQHTGALLGAGLRKAGRFCGALCVEHAGERRPWSEREILYAAAMADLIAQRLVHEDVQVNRASRYQPGPLARLTLREEEARYRALFECAGDSIFLMKQDRFVDCNKATSLMFGCTRQQILNETPYRYSPEFQPDGRRSRDKALEKINAAFRGETQCFEWRHVRHDGTPFDSEVTLNVIETDGEPHLLAMVRDISGRKLAEQELAQSRQALLDRNESLRLVNELSSRLHRSCRVTDVVDQTMDALVGMSRNPHVAIYLVDEQRRRLRLASCHGYCADTERSASLPLEGSLSGLALARGCPMVSHELATDERIAPDIKAMLVESGFRSAMVVPLIYDGQPLGSINLLYMESSGFGSREMETLQTMGKTVSLSLANVHHMAEMEYLAHHDSLTRLPNRAMLHREFERRASDRSGRYEHSALMLLDLDRFKEVNDTLGHYVGDALLKQIGPRLTSLLGDDSLLCRLGGDEFTVLAACCSAPAEVQALALRLLDALREPFQIENMMLELDASIGIAIYPQHGEDSHALLRSADVAMYEAKRKGSGCVLYDKALDPHSPQRLAIMSELGAAIREQQLCLHYQPKVELASGGVTGFEALVRWQHPTQGLLYPDRFIPVAEVSDVIHQLSHHVLELALRQQRHWREAGHDVGVAVNLSARNLVDERCLRIIEALLQEYAVDAGNLELEITETALMHDPEGAVKLLTRIAGLGVRLSIDDFGTGYSSLAYLRRLPIHALKIDRVFVRDMLHNEQDAIIVRSIIALAHNLNLQVVAEGVEDAGTLRALKDMGCDQVQGYHIGRPAPSQDVAGWLAGHPALSGV